MARIESDRTLRDGVDSLISNISCTKQSNLFLHFLGTKNCLLRSFGKIGRLFIFVYLYRCQCHELPCTDRLLQISLLQAIILIKD